MADPGDLAERAELVEQARLVARDPGRAGRRAPARRRESARPTSWSTTSARRSSAALPRSGAGSAPTARHALPGRQEPAERLRVDGLDLAAEPRERAAAELAQDLGIAPLALRAARAGTRRAGSCRRRRAAPARPRPRRAAAPQRAAGSVARNGPWLRANRASRPSSAPVTRTRNASGTPRGGEAPTPSRYRPTSSIATQRSSPPMRICDRAPRRRQLAQPARPRPPRRPRPARRPRRPDRSPMRRSRSWRCSRLFAWRSSVERTGARARGPRAPRDRAARAAPPGRAARAAGRGPAPGRRRGARPAARRPRTCTRPRSRTGATTRTARPSTVSTPWIAISRRSMPPRTSRSASRSNTSERHSRYVSTRIGKQP